MLRFKVFIEDVVTELFAGGGYYEHSQTWLGTLLNVPWPVDLQRIFNVGAAPSKAWFCDLEIAARR